MKKKKKKDKKINFTLFISLAAIIISLCNIIYTNKQTVLQEEELFIQKTAFEQFRKQLQEEKKDKYAELQISLKDISLKYYDDRIGIIEEYDLKKVSKNKIKEFFIELVFTNKGDYPISQTEIKYIFFTTNEFDGRNTPNNIIPFDPVTLERIKIGDKVLFDPFLSNRKNKLEIKDALIDLGTRPSTITKGSSGLINIRTGIKENEIITSTNGSKTYLGVLINYVDKRTNIKHKITECYVLPQYLQVNHSLGIANNDIKSKMDIYIFDAYQETKDAFFVINLLNIDFINKTVSIDFIHSTKTKIIDVKMLKNNLNFDSNYRQPPKQFNNSDYTHTYINATNYVKNLEYKFIVELKGEDYKIINYEIIIDKYGGFKKTKLMPTTHKNNKG